MRCHAWTAKNPPKKREFLCLLHPSVYWFFPFQYFSNMIWQERKWSQTENKFTTLFTVSAFSVMYSTSTAQQFTVSQTSEQIYQFLLWTRTNTPFVNLTPFLSNWNKNIHKGEIFPFIVGFIITMISLAFFLSLKLPHSRDFVFLTTEIW